MANFLFSAYFCGHFVTIAKVKDKSIPEFYTLAIALIIFLKETTEKQLLFFYLKGGQNSLLMHVPLYAYVRFDSLTLENTLKLEKLTFSDLSLTC